MTKRLCLMLALLASAACFANLAHATQTIFINAKVITVDAAHPSAQAFAIDNGRFTAVGTNAEILKLKTASTTMIDLKGMTVTPGFNDAHLHPQAIFDENSQYYRVWLGADRVKTIDDLVAALKKKAAITPPGKLINGYGYNDVTLGRHPNRHDLDLVSTTQPVSITHGSGHITVVNSFMLEAAGVTKETPDPPGGALDRDPDGTPNGVLRESGRGMLSRGRREQQLAGSSDKVATSDQPSEGRGQRGEGRAQRGEAGDRRDAGPNDRMSIPHDDEIKGYLNCFKQYSARGITSVGIAGGSPSSFRLMQELRDQGNPVRVGFMFGVGSFDDLQAAGIQRGFGDDRLRISSLKNFQGNSLSGRTAWLSQAYSDRPGYFGIQPARSQEKLDEDVQKWWDAGWQVATHSNGDREIDMMLTAIERAEAKNPRPDARWRIEHASVMNQALLDRAKKDGVILVFHSYMWEYGNILASYGPERLSMMHAYRTAIDMGIHVAGHSDSPISAAYPLLRIQDMVTRKSQQGVPTGAEQKIGVEEAIKVWTLDGAYATFEENNKGSITPGKLADFVILQKDPRAVPPDTIKDILLEATYLGGQKVYTAPEKAVAMTPQPPINYGDGNYGDGDEEENENGSN
ncbi:MAG: amidohydrolase [Terracidiphilus sp.]